MNQMIENEAEFSSNPEGKDSEKTGQEDRIGRQSKRVEEEFPVGLRLDNDQMDKLIFLMKAVAGERIMNSKTNLEENGEREASGDENEKSGMKREGGKETGIGWLA